MKSNLFKQHREHNEWTSEFSFYKEQLNSMQKQLEDINSKNTGSDVKAEVDHFQNQFTIQNKNIDDILEEVREDEKVIEASINENAVATDHRKKEDHAEEREHVENFEKNFNDLRKEFHSFLEKVM